MGKTTKKYSFLCLASILISTSLSIDAFAVVLGADIRTQVTNTTSYSNSAIVHLDGVTSSSEFSCTGWMVGPHTLVTAAHCVNEGTRNITVSPGKNESRNPYGTAKMRQVHASPDYIYAEPTQRNPGDDWAVVNIDKDLGNQTGWFGYNSGLPNGSITVTGYPADKNYGQMWKGVGSIEWTNGNIAYHNVDTFGGQSGAPIYDYNNQVYAIHVGYDGNVNRNRAARINQEVINAIESMKRQ
jgi:glutamyl endopeptidase